MDDFQSVDPIGLTIEYKNDGNRQLSSDEPWLDRQLKYFEPIFDFYQSGNKIQRNEYLDLDFFLDELEFFKVRYSNQNSVNVGRTRISGPETLVKCSQDGFTFLDD